jgi:hypothetical protein
MKKQLFALITAGLILGSTCSTIMTEQHSTIKKAKAIALHLAQTIGGLTLAVSGISLGAILGLSTYEDYQEDESFGLNDYCTIAAMYSNNLCALIAGGIIAKMGITNLINDFKKTTVPQ